MKNYVQPGHTLTLTAPYNRAGGQGALVGSIFGVAMGDVASGAASEFAVEGVFDLAKTTSQAWTAGALIYWDDTTKSATNVASTNKLIGVAAQGQGAADTVGRVRLNGAFTS